eukprot:7072996-Prymnesium_polylepis.1
MRPTAAPRAGQTRFAAARRRGPAVRPRRLQSARVAMWARLAGHLHSPMRGARRLGAMAATRRGCARARRAEGARPRERQR